MRKVMDAGNSNSTFKLCYLERTGAWAKFKRNRVLHFYLVFLAVLSVIMAVSPYDRYDWFLENLLVFIFLGTLAYTYRKFRFTNFSYLLITVFVSLHIIGAHYSYTTTPLDDWMKRAFGYSRDNYDRIVHFAFGLLMTFPAVELFQRVLKLQRTAALVFSVLAIMGASALYEIIEMWVAMIVSPEIGTLFLGTQGDEWDTQKDMACALYGALVCGAGCMAFWKLFSKKVLGFYVGGKPLKENKAVLK